MSEEKKFRYFDTSSALQVSGDKMRVTADSPLVIAYEEMGASDITFAAWWGHFAEETRQKLMADAPEGAFIMDWGEGEIPLSVEDGEPIAE